MTGEGSVAMRLTNWWAGSHSEAERHGNAISIAALQTKAPAVGTAQQGWQIAGTVGGGGY